MMHYRELGHTGRKISDISFGAWAIGGSWGTVDDRESMAALYERRTGPHKMALEDSLAPATRWDPVLPGLQPRVPTRDRFVRSKTSMPVSK